MLRNIILALLLLSLGMLLAEPALNLSTPLPIDPDLTIGKLPNGITYYIKVNKKPEKRAELRLVVNIGSVQEDDDQLGLAHFTEHMAFNGTKHFKKSELVDYLNSIGFGFMNGLNAATSMDMTAYQLPTPTDTDEQLDKAFLILSDWASGVSFDNDEIERERGIIIEEWRGGQGAADRIFNKQRKVLFSGSRYGERMPIGKLEILQNFKPETIKRFYTDWYRPDTQAVVAVGDFDPVKVENLIKQYFSSIPVKQNPRPLVIYPVPDNEKPLVVIATDPELPESDVQLIWKHPNQVLKTAGDYRASLVVNLYTQMLNGRLQELSQQAEPPFTYGYNFKYNMVRSKSNYILSAGVPEAGIIKGLTTLLTEAERVQRYGFTATEFDRAKVAVMRAQERMLAEKDKQDSGRLVWRYVGNFAYDNPLMSIEQNVELNRSLYDGITLDEVNSVCRQLVTDRNMAIAVSAPEKEGLVLPTEAELLALSATVNASEISAYVDNVTDEPLIGKLPPAGKVVKTKSYSKIGVTEWTLSNGIKVLLKPTDFKNDEIMLKAFSPGGTSLYGLKDLMEAGDAPGIISDSGVGVFEAVALQKKLTGKIASVDPYIDSQKEGFYANCSKADMETMFQLINLYATAPRKDAQSYASWLTKTKTYLQNAELDPEKAYSDSTYALLFDHNPRIKNPTIADLDKFSLDKIFRIYQERFADFTDFTFIVVGSFEPSVLQGLCEKYLAVLPAAGKKEKSVDTGVRYVKGKQNMTVYKGADNKSTVQMFITGNLKYSSKTKSELTDLTYLMNEKLRENIRETRSGVYTVAAYPQVKRFPKQEYNITIYMQCAPERVVELSEAVFATLDSIKAGQFDNKYVDVVKITRTKRLETDVKENRWWQNKIDERVWNRLDLNALLEEQQLISTVSKKSLQKAAKTYLIYDKNLVQSVLYPASMMP